MATPLNPQEIYLLETFSSLAYYQATRDAWRQMLDVVEAGMDRFMSQLPADYRSRSMSEQPDIGWGMRVIPNFRSAMNSLDTGLVLLKAGDLLGLKYGSGLISVRTGQIRDYPPYWMTDEEARGFSHWINIAVTRSSAIGDCTMGSWAKGELLRPTLWDIQFVQPPIEWPTYRINTAVRCKTGDEIPQSGIYLPDADDSVPMLMIKGDDFPVDEAEIGADPEYGRSTGQVPTTWTLVERIADTGGGTPGDTDPIKAGVRLRCEAKQPCPRAGYWFTPARASSRTHFETGQPMPDVGGTWGATIWQWDEQQ